MKIRGLGLQDFRISGLAFLIWVEILDLGLQDFKISGLDFGISVEIRGFKLRISGFGPKSRNPILKSWNLGPVLDFH